MINRYQNISITKNKIKTPTFYVNAIYPDIPVSDGDTYVITVLGDRMDLMAQDFYGDTGYWWIIASANSLSCDSLFPPIGMQLRLPQDLQEIVSKYNQVNRIR